MSSSSTPANTTTQITIRFAPYVENRHESFLSTVFSEGDKIIDKSPFFDYDFIDIDVSFFGLGYAIGDYTALYDAYGKYLAGMDIEIKWSKSFSSVYDQDEATESLIKKKALIEDNFSIKVIPEFLLSMRENNCVSSSTYTIGKALLDCDKIKEIEKLSLKERFDLIPSVFIHFNTELDWFRKLTTLYATIIKEYLTVRSDVDDIQTTMQAKDKLWPFEIIDFEGCALGALRGAATYQKRGLVRKRSTLSKVLSVSSYVATGAYIGSSWGPVGAIIGAVVGAVVGIAMLFFE